MNNIDKEDSVQRTILFKILTRAINAHNNTIKSLDCIPEPFSSTAARILTDECQRVWSIEAELKALGFTEYQIKIGVLEWRVFELEKAMVTN